MVYAIALKQKTVKGNTVYLLKDNHLGAVNPQRCLSLIKTWKTWIGANKRWLDLVNQVSAYANGSEIVIIPTAKMYIDGTTEVLLVTENLDQNGKVWVSYPDGYQSLVLFSRLSHIHN
jgi:hypothetical protein